MRGAAIGLTLAACLSMRHWPVDFPGPGAGLALWSLSLALALSIAWIVERLAVGPRLRILMGSLMGFTSAIVLLPMFPGEATCAVLETYTALGLGVGIGSIEIESSAIRSAMRGLIFGMLITPCVVAGLIEMPGEPLSSAVAGAAIVPPFGAALALLCHGVGEELGFAVHGMAGLVAGIGLGWHFGCAAIVVFSMVGFGLGLLFAAWPLIVEDAWTRPAPRNSGSPS